MFGWRHRLHRRDAAAEFVPAEHPHGRRRAAAQRRTRLLTLVLLVALLAAVAGPGSAGQAASAPGSSDDSPAARKAASAGTAGAALDPDAGRRAEAVQGLWRALGWPLPAEPADRPVTRGELAGWLVAALVGPAGEPLPPDRALALAVGMGWVPASWVEPAGPQAPRGSAAPVPQAPEVAAPPTAGGAGPAGAVPSPQVPVTPLDLEDVAARVLTGAAANGAPNQGGTAGAGSPGGRAGGTTAPGPRPEEAGRETVRLAEAMPWFLALMDQAGALFDGEGVVTAVDAGAGWVEVDQGGLRRVLLLAEAPVFRNGRRVEPAALRPGDQVRWVEQRPRAGGVPGVAGPVEPPAGGGSTPAAREAPGAGSTLTRGPSVAAAYVEAYRWTLEGTVRQVDWRAGQLVLALPAGIPSQAAGPPAGAVGATRPGPRRAPVPRAPAPWAAAAGAAAAATGLLEPEMAGGEMRLELRVEDGAPVHLNGRPSRLAALQPGDRVVLDLRWATGTVRGIEALRAAVDGRLVAVDALRGVLTVRTGSGTARWVVATTASIRRDGREALLSDLQPGDHVELALVSPSVAGFVVAEGAGAGDGATGAGAGW